MSVGALTPLVMLTAFVALVVVFRPSDATVLGAGLTIAGLLWRGTTVWWEVLVAIAG